MESVTFKMKFVRDMSNTKLVTHAECSDGSGCAIVFLEAGGVRENIRFVPAGTGVEKLLNDEPEFFSTANHVIIADVSCDAETADDIEKKYGNCIIIDHHKSALHLKDRDWCHIDVSVCGSMLLYYYFFTNSSSMRAEDLHRLCQLINDRDMWILKEEASDELQLYMNFYGQERFIDRMWSDLFCHGWKEHEETFVNALKKKREDYIENALKKVFIREVDGKKLGYVFISDHQSMVLNRLIEKYNLDAGVGIMLDGAVVSLRAKGAVDVSVICEGYGGGGHANAAGHRLPDEVLEEILEVIHP